MNRANWKLTLAGVLLLANAVPQTHAQEGPETGATTAGSSSASHKVSHLRSRFSTPVGSPYAELDSWVYPAIERLAALGYINSDFPDARPWPRIECARLVQEAAGFLENDPFILTEAQRLYSELKREFQPELNALAGSGQEKTIRLESLYTASAGVTGRPLNDSYHFGQTIINNYGRPYEEGFNSYEGFSAYAVVGRFTIYTRGEVQHAPSAPAYPLAARQAIASADNTPLRPATPIAAVNQFRLLDTYAAANVAGWDLSFGKQSLWWAPNYGGAMLFSDNAEPIYMARVSRIAPFELPWVLRWLGPVKLDLFMGKLSGNEYPPRPLIHGEKFTFKPTENLDLSFSRTGEFGGVGRAMTLGAIIRAYVAFNSSVNYAASENPGERNGGFDFSYRIPGIRNWLTVYGDLMSRDDPNPLDAPRRSSENLGLYLPRIPYVPRLDFRVEGINTNPVSAPARNGQFDYWETFYRDLYTNKNNIIGDWIGREGTGFQAWTAYWLNSRSTIQLGYRHEKVSEQFIPSGETLNDGSVAVNWWLHDDLQLNGFLQYEKWLAPILAPGPQTDWTSSVSLTFWPKSLQR